MIPVLMVHNYYHQKNPSGENVSFEAEAALLHSRGHRVVSYTRHNDEIDRYSARDRAGMAFGAIWSSGTRQSIRRLIAETRPEVAHFQNTFPLISPSAYQACAEAGLPVVQTLWNYRLACPSATFFREGRVCEDCLGKTPPWPGVVHGCYRDSRAGTAVVATMLTVHRLLRTWTEAVDVYVALTEFARQKLIQVGLPAEKIVVKPCFVDPDPGPGEHRGNYAVFAGRLAPEKGIETLLRAWEQLGGRISLKIVGDGPLADRVAEAVGRMPGVEWLGRRPVGEVYDLLGDARAVIFPSEWYETFGRVAIEAYAKGTPVIGSNLGAIPEVIDHGRTGLLFTPGDAEDLAAQVEWAWGHERWIAEMGEQARREYETKYAAERNYRMLTEIYALATARANNRPPRRWVTASTMSRPRDGEPGT